MALDPSGILNSLIPYDVTISVDDRDIREARCRSDLAGRPRSETLSPVLLALRRGSRYTNGEFVERGVVLITWETHRRILYGPCPELQAYIQAWARGDDLQPATFVLTLPAA